MNHEAVMKFKAMFEEERRRIIARGVVDQTLHIEKDDLLDEVDQSSTELETAMRMRLRNREALFLKKIDQALARIASGGFGECVDCGDDIEQRRLEARPTATHCVACKETQERLELSHIDGHRPKSLGALGAR